MKLFRLTAEQQAIFDIEPELAMDIHIAKFGAFPSELLFVLGGMIALQLDEQLDPSVRDLLEQPWLRRIETKPYGLDVQEREAAFHDWMEGLDGVSGSAEAIGRPVAQQLAIE